LSAERAARIADVTDGTSNSVAATELLTRNTAGDNSQGLWGYAGAAYIVAYNDKGPTAGSNYAANSPPASTEVMTPNCNASVAVDGPCFTYTPHHDNANPPDRVFGGNDGVGAGARSRHTGGVNVALVDGGVRFVSDTVDGRIWLGAFTIQGGEVLGNW